jgi:hypothetical protein
MYERFDGMAEFEGAAISTDLAAEYTIRQTSES